MVQQDLNICTAHTRLKFFLRSMLYSTLTGEGARLLAPKFPSNYFEELVFAEVALGRKVEERSRIQQRAIDPANRTKTSGKTITETC